MIERARLEERTRGIPQHVALVMGGSDGWVRERGLTTLQGDRAAARALRETARAAAGCGVEVLTVHTPSEGFARVFALREMDALRQAEIRVATIGRLASLPDAARAALDAAARATSACTGLLLNLAVNYGARAELADAFRSLALDVRAGRLGVDAIDDEVLAGYLYTPSLPDPDLVIRTGGTHRISDFLLYQCAYSELWSTTTRWPDFDGRELGLALHAYARRQRRFGS
jgi:undecaprenyl diphosphate synthase